MDTGYWYFVQSFRTRGKEDLLHEAGVFNGSFADMVLRIKSQEEKHYTNFTLLNWAVIPKEEFDILDGMF